MPCSTAESVFERYIIAHFGYNTIEKLPLSTTAQTAGCIGMREHFFSLPTPTPSKRWESDELASEQKVHSKVVAVVSFFRV